jgi:Flp pilus assembly pilin Flp
MTAATQAVFIDVLANSSGLSAHAGNWLTNLRTSQRIENNIRWPVAAAAARSTRRLWMKLSTLLRRRNAQRGQGMTEYIIIVALIAVAAIGVYALFGKTIRNQVAGLAGEVAGTGSTSAISAAGAAAGSAATTANTDKKMNTYGN